MSMTYGKLSDAACLARRFIALAEAMVEEIADESQTVSQDSCLVSGTALSGFVRRASLDLTRSLAELRK